MRNTITNSRRIILLLTLSICATVFIVSTGCDGGKSKSSAIDDSSQLESVRVYIELGMYDKAMASLNKLEKQSPDNKGIKELKAIVAAKLSEQPALTRDDLEAAAKALSADPNDRAATDILAKGKADSVPYLIQLLKSDNSLVRLTTIRLIAQNPTADAIPALLEGLNSHSPDTAYYSHLGLCKLTNTNIDILLRDDGAPDGQRLTEVWNKKLISMDLVASSKPAPTHTSVYTTNRITAQPVTVTYTPSRTPARSAERSQMPITPAPPSRQPSSIAPSSQPSPSPTPTPKPKVKTTKTPSKPRITGPETSGKSRPGIGGPQIN